MQEKTVETLSAIACFAIIIGMAWLFIVQLAA
jgi:hypothetical protein